MHHHHRAPQLHGRRSMEQREVVPVPLPFLLGRMAAMEEEERRIKARCIAAGLAPLPPSIIGVRFYASADRQILLSKEHLHLAFALHAAPAVKVHPSSTAVTGQPQLSLSLAPPAAAAKGVQSPETSRKRRATSNMAARRRRMDLSERMRELAELTPWDRKLDTSTLLEEARRYVLFLRAQAEVLRCMPAAGEEGNHQLGASRRDALGDAVNSRRVQDWMYRREVCLCCVEQRRALVRQGIWDGGVAVAAACYSPPPSASSSSSSLAFQLEQPQQL